MSRLVIELKENGELNIYTDSDVDLTLVDWNSVRDDVEDSAYHKTEIVEAAERELLHKTTGLKQVYP